MIDPRGLAPLDEAECWRRLAAAPVGRIAFCLEGRPHVLPVTHAVVDRTVVFRTGPGSKLAAAAHLDEVVYEVDEANPASREGWSVLLRGTADLVTDPDQLERLFALDVVPWADSGQVDWVQITPIHITGRCIQH